MKDWDYANMSRAAKEAGGPKEYYEATYESGRSKGHLEMAPVIGLAIFLVYIVIPNTPKFFRWSYKKISCWIQKKRDLKETTDLVEEIESEDVEELKTN